MKNNAVIITCGKNSLHQYWKNLSSYNFDIYLIVYDETIFNSDSLKEITGIMYNTGWKWVLISEFLEKYNLNSYDYIMFMDDDLEILPTHLNDYFNYIKENNIHIAQPALTNDSYFSHRVTLQKTKTHRIVNTVEIMCPTFNKECFNKALTFLKIPNLRNNIIGICWYLELLIEDFLTDKNGNTISNGKVAIVDKYPVKHTKPIGLTYKNIDPGADIEFYKKYFNWNPNLNRNYIIEEI
jgi:hypothetical protein